MAVQDITGSTDDEQAVACALGTADLKSQADRWETVLSSSGIQRLETDDGIRLRFRADAGVEAELSELVAVENDCCGWAAWTVTTAGAEVEVVVTSTGDGITALHGMLTGRIS
jgi:hypothetical protein